MSLSDFIKQNETIYSDEVTLKYLFIPAKHRSNHLFVMFSGFTGKEKEGDLSKYQYVRHTQEIDCNKLFILDIYDGLPCYYLGKNKKLDYENSVVSLINYISSKCGINNKDIITCGTSKGGTAALYLAMKYGYGHNIVGGMQTLVGDYIYSMNFTRDNVLKLITGDSDEKSRDYLNAFYQEIFDNPKNNTEYNIHGGAGDTHYKRYVKPFIDNLKGKNIPFNLEVKDYESHSDLGKFYPNFLIDNLIRITGRQIQGPCSSIKFTEGELVIDCIIPEDLKKKESLVFAFYIYKDNNKEPLEKFMYSSSPLCRLPIKESGKYRSRIFIKTSEEKIAFSSDSVEVALDRLIKI